MTRLLDLALDAANSIRAHALRFALTASGVAWGAFLLTFLSATMQGIDRHFASEFRELGPDLVYFGGGRVLRDRVGERGARPVELEREDVERVDALAVVRAATPVVDLGTRLVRANGRTRLLHVEGVGPTAEGVRNLAPRTGRFLAPSDVARRARAAVVGPRVAERLFGRGADALGRWIQIESLRFRVVGVTPAKGEQLMNPGDPDDLKIWIPFTTAQRWFARDDVVHEVVYTPVAATRSRESVRRVREVTSLHHAFTPDVEPALWVFDTHDALDPIFAGIDALSLFVSAAGAVTLLVGAVGVMNIMLVVAGERRREIGLRKAVGATSRAIFAQFLTEAALVAIAAAAAGTALGVALTALVANLVPDDSPLATAAAATPGTIAGIALTLVGVAVVAGVAPALRAARTPPAEALRAG
ncbi:MAG: ABC transporter permease [Myxococcota bacterium]